MKKRIISIALVLAVLFAMAPVSMAAEPEGVDAAYLLYDLGLFQGVGVNSDGTPIFDLERAPTRYEAVTMLVRLLGKETEAKAGQWSTPFIDLVDWAKPYVGYAYENGLTKGTGAITFGGDAKVSAAQYITFVLRALGYSSETDFAWDAAWELSDSIGLTEGEYSAEANEISRGGVAIISADALDIALKQGDEKLSDKLISEGVFSAGIYEQLKTVPEEIVIDVDEFIAKCNADHEAITELKYSAEWYESYAPDFHDTLNLVSRAEADALLNTKRGMSYMVCTKEAALKDIELLFRVFESFYGPYYYFGGKETFSAAQEKIIERINAYSGTMTLEDLSIIVIESLDFIKDRHMDVGEYAVCEYNQVAVHDYYVRGLFFYEDELGFYTKLQGRKWYLEAVGADENIEDYLKITVDEKGQLCYMPGLSVVVSDARLNIKQLSLARGEQKISLPITWTEFDRRALEPVAEKVSIKNGIPLLEIDFNLNGSTSGPQQEEQQERVRQMGSAFLKQETFILDINSGSGCQSLFDSIRHHCAEVVLYKLSKTADYLGRWNMPWDWANFGEYAIENIEGIWGENDTLVFAVQDKNCFSAQEGTIVDIRAIENVITIGGTTGGTAGASGATNQGMVLPNTRLYVHFGASLAISSGFTEEGYCIEPDIWVNPTEAVDAAYRLCEFYGIENNADTSVLDKYK